MCLRLKFLPIGFLALLLLTSCNEPSSNSLSSTDADIDQIKALQIKWNQAVEMGDIDGYISVLDEEIELIPTDAPAFQGTESYRGMLEGVFSTSTFDIEVVDAGTIEVEGNMAYARYDYIIHTTSIPSDSIQTTTTVSSYRKFLDVMRRQSDGSWRVYKHIWNYNEPVVAL